MNINHCVLYWCLFIFINLFIKDFAQNNEAMAAYDSYNCQFMVVKLFYRTFLRCRKIRLNTVYVKVPDFKNSVCCDKDIKLDVNFMSVLTVMKLLS